MIKNLILTIGLIAVAGCSLFSATNAAPPTKAEQSLFDVSNSVVQRVITQTNFVNVTLTNITWATKWITNELNVPIPQLITMTNYLDVQVPRYVQVTQDVVIQQLVPGRGSAAATSIIGLIASFFGAGGIATTAAAGLTAIYLKSRNRALAGDNDNLAVVSGGLVETTETLLNVLKGTPQGQVLLPKVKLYLERHQEDLGTVQQVKDILSTISKSKSVEDAQEILDKLKSA
jgi:hypothetical protein